MPELSTPDTDTTVLHAGTAKREITVCEPGIEVNDPLYARALVLDDGKSKIAIISMDAIAIGTLRDIGNDFLGKLRILIENELDIPVTNVLVNATHTHTTDPMLCPPDEQLERTFAAVCAAARNMVRVKFGAGSGYEDRIMVNRDLRMKDGTYWTIRQANPCPPDADVAELGPVDPEIGILRFDRLDGSPLAVVYNFACHPMIGVSGNRVTANFPGFASKMIEETLGYEVMALFLQGACGNITEVLYKDVNRPRNSEPVGIMLGQSVLNAVKKIHTGDAALSVISENIALPRRTDIPERIAALLHEQARLLESMRFTSLNLKTFLPLYIKHALAPNCPADYSYRYLQEEQTGCGELSAMDAENRRNIDKYLQNIYAMEKLSRIQDDIATLKRHQAINEQAGQALIQAEVLCIMIGDCVLITAPLEALVEIGLNVKKASPCKHTFIAAVSNGYMYYGPPASHFGKGGYESNECFLAPEWQEIYESAAAGIVHRLL